MKLSAQFVIGVNAKDILFLCQALVETIRVLNGTFQHHFGLVSGNAVVSRVPLVQTAAPLLSNTARGQQLLGPRHTLAQ